MNLHIEDAAKKIGVKPERLAACESGEALLTINQLRSAASVYKRPLAAFYLPEPPKDFHVPHDYRRLRGEAIRPLSPELVTAIRTAQYHRSLACELAEDVDAATPDFVGSVSLPARVNGAAERIRQLLGVSLEVQKSWRGTYDPLNCWKEAIERAGVLVFHFSHVDVGEVRAFSIADRPFPVISINGGDSPNGRVFSLFHEFAHLLLGHGGTCDFREREGVRDADQAVEVFCNSVAGATLVPPDDIGLQAGVEEASSRTEWSNDQLAALAKLYGVSSQVILRRLLTISKTNRAFYRARQDELVKLGKERQRGRDGFLTVPQRVIRAVGQPFLRIVLNAYHREAITSSDLAEYIGARLKHLPTIEGRMLGPNLLTGSDM